MPTIRRRNGRGRLLSDFQGASRHQGGAPALTPAQQLVANIKAIAVPQVLLVDSLGVLNASDQPITVAGTFVKTWQDQSGNGNHAVQSVVGNQPEWQDAAGLISGVGPLFGGKGGLDSIAQQPCQMQGPLVTTGGQTLFLVGMLFGDSNTPSVWVATGTSGQGWAAAGAAMLFGSNPSTSAIESRHGVPTCTQSWFGGNPATEGMANRNALIVGQFNGTTDTMTQDGRSSTSPADAVALSGTVYSLFSDPNKAAAAQSILQCVVIYNTILSGGNMASIAALLKAYYGTP